MKEMGQAAAYCDRAYSVTVVSEQAQMRCRLAGAGLKVHVRMQTL